MLRKEWFRPKKLRVLLAWIAIPFLIYYTNINDTSYRWGAILMGIGELIRLWSLGYVERKGKQLAMSGPYAFTRNPLYIGNFFLGLGVAVLVANWIIMGIFLIGFVWIYKSTVQHEENDLREKFGAPYELYCKNVPRFFPRLSPYQAATRDSFDWQRIIKHHEYVTVLGIILVLCGIHLYDELVFEKDSFASQIPLVILTAIIGLIILFERFIFSGFGRMFAEGFPNLFLKKKK